MVNNITTKHLKKTNMEKTVMQKHLEWLKGRMVVSLQMESQLLEEEKQQITNAIIYANNMPLMASSKMLAEGYYNNTFKQD